MQFPIEQFTAKQQLFILHYCRTQHLTNSALAAGIKQGNAASQGSKWMANSKIKAEITRRLELRNERYFVEPNRIIREMALMAFSNLNDFVKFTEDNRAIADFGQVTKDQMASLTEIVTEEFRTRDGELSGVRNKIKMADKQSALMNLAKLINMLKPEQHEHHGVVEHQHKHAHVVINPRDMSPGQRERLKSVLLAIESGEKDEPEEADDEPGDHEAR